MKKLLLLLSVIVVLLSSCGEGKENTKDYYYRVKYITSGAKEIVIDRELAVGIVGSYSVGDTVHVTPAKLITNDGRFKKAIITHVMDK